MRILRSIILVFLSSGVVTLALQTEVVLVKVVINGLEDLDEQVVIKGSGLELNQVINQEKVNEAAALLGNSGFFSRVGFRFQTTDSKMTVTFEVQESGKLRPCLYDNFLGFTEPELAGAIRSQLPLFAGFVPEVGTSLQRIVNALQDLLSRSGIPGTVSYEPLVDLVSEELSFLFKIEGRKLFISEIDFHGMTEVSLTDLKLASASLIRKEFSLFQLIRFLELQVKPVFYEKGYLRAEFLSPVGLLGDPDSVNLGTPVQVSVQVNEGIQYFWAGADWDGATKLYGPALDKLLGMEIDEVADGTRIEQGFKSILEEFGKFGLMEVELSPEPEFLEGENRILYHVSIDEGRQFRMGNLELRGFTFSDVKELTDRWRIKPGEIYDTSYLSEFLDKEIPSVVSNEKKLKLETKTRSDTEKLVVNVQITAR